MQMDIEARALVAQIVKALRPLGGAVLTPDEQARPDADPFPRGQPTLGQVRAAAAAMAAGNAALAATAS